MSRQKSNDSDIFKTFLMVSGVFFVGWATTKLLGMKDDNPIEEAAEDIIQRTAGIDIDITPNSRERG